MRIKFIASFVFLILSNSALALTSICSGDLLPLTGLNTLKHEASWSYYDNWFYNMFIEISSEVEGPTSPTLVDEFEMQTGGSALHFLDSPPDGSYTLKGYVQIGYPLGWGFDGYYGIECPSWAGDVTNPDEPKNETSLNPALVSVKAGEVVQLSDPEECGQSEAQSCAIDLDIFGSAASLVLDRPKIQNGRVSPPVVTTGILDGIGNGTLVVRTSVGRYVNFTVDETTKISRRIRTNSANVEAADKVGVYWGSSQKTDAGALQVRIFRGAAPVRAELADVVLPSGERGLEMTSAINKVQPVAGRDVRLVYDKGTTTLLVPEDSSVTLVEPALLEDLLPIISNVRVISQTTEDGLFHSIAIEILQ